MTAMNFYFYFLLLMREKYGLKKIKRWSDVMGYLSEGQLAAQPRTLARAGGNGYDYDYVLSL